MSPQTKGSLLRFSLWYALGRVKVHIGRRVYPLGLTNEMRTQIAADVVNDMGRYGQWRELDKVVAEGPQPSWAIQQQVAADKDKGRE
jgi:hypothetical protein